MGLLSSTGSLTRYRVEGKIQGSVIDTVRNGLKENKLAEIDNTPLEKAVGWTSIENPYLPDFEGSSFSFGTYFVFSMRVDKKSVPTKIINKHYLIKVAKKLSEEGRAYLSSNEKRMIKDHVKNVLTLRIPATPNIYDVLWDYENASLWLFSTLKSANEDLEELFSKSFQINLIRLFPFTVADGALGLSDSERDLLSKTSPSKFRE